MQQALIDFLADGVPKPAWPLPFKAARPERTLEGIFRSLDLVPTPILIGMNPESSNIRSNAAGRALFGETNQNLSQSAPEWARPNFRVFSDGVEVPPHELPMQVAGRTGQPVEGTECELRFADGTVKFIRGRAVPVFARDGGVRGTIGVFLDVTSVQEKERQHLLELEEVKHRAKNTLALVQSVANFTLKSKLDPAVYGEFVERLHAISRTVDVSPHKVGEQTLRDVVRATLDRQRGESFRQISMDGPDIIVPAKTHTPLAMAIHELATNAAKYGALSAPNGVVTIQWQMTDPGVAVVEWTERGGPPVMAPSHLGFGSRLLSQILGSASGRQTEMHFDPSGLKCRLYVTLA